LENNPHIFLVGSSAVYINENGEEIRRFRKYNNYKMLAWRLRKSCSIIYPSIMFRNEDVFLNKDIESNDYNLYFELLEKGKNLTNLPQFLIKYRVHSGSMSIYDKEKFDQSKEEVIRKFKSLEDKTNFYDKINYSIKLIFHYLKTIREKKVRIYS